MLLVAGGASASKHGSPATWVSIVKIVLGVLLLLLAVKQWRGPAARGHAAGVGRLDEEHRHVHADQVNRNGRRPFGRARAASQNLDALSDPRVIEDVPVLVEADVGLEGSGAKANEPISQRLV